MHSIVQLYLCHFERFGSRFTQRSARAIDRRRVNVIFFGTFTVTFNIEDEGLVAVTTASCIVVVMLPRFVRCTAVVRLS